MENSYQTSHQTGLTNSLSGSRKTDRTEKRASTWSADRVETEFYAILNKYRVIVAIQSPCILYTLFRHSDEGFEKMSINNTNLKTEFKKASSLLLRQKFLRLLKNRRKALTIGRKKEGGLSRPDWRMYL